MNTSSAGLSELNVLEEKVDRVAGRIDELRVRNVQLDNEIRHLREQLVGRDKTVAELRRDLAESNLVRRDFAKEDAIRGKLTTLLEKLNSLEEESVG